MGYNEQVAEWAAGVPFRSITVVSDGEAGEWHALWGEYDTAREAVKTEIARIGRACGCVPSDEQKAKRRGWGYSPDHRLACWAHTSDPAIMPLHQRWAAACAAIAAHEQAAGYTIGRPQDGSVWPSPTTTFIDQRGGVI